MKKVMLSVKRVSVIALTAAILLSVLPAETMEVLAEEAKERAMETEDDNFADEENTELTSDADDIDDVGDINVLEPEEINEFGDDIISETEVILPEVDGQSEEDEKTDIEIIESIQNADSGTSDNISWEITDNVLYIHGTGVVPQNAFKKNTDITDVIFDDGITEIGSQAFYGCTGLKNIVLPDSVTALGCGAFSDCTGLTSVKLSKNLRTLGGNTFRYCTGLTEIEVPKSLEKASKSWLGSDGLKDYGSGEFFGCENLKTITFEDGITQIPPYLFYNSKSIETITIPDTVTVIGADAFCGCSGLKDVSLSQNLTEIRIRGFYGCTGLKNIVLPDSITLLGDGVFSDCLGLTAVTLPNSLRSIGGNAFRYCVGLSEIKIPGGIEKVNNSYIGENGLNGLGTGVFYGCENLKTVTFEDGVTQIPAYLFYNAASLQSITLPTGVRKIGDYAFYNCSSLTGTYIPETVSEIGKYVFDGVNNNIIYCPKGSYAMIYAIENQKRFETSGSYIDNELFVLDRGETDYKLITDSVGINGYIAARLSYKIKPSWQDSVSDMAIQIKLPNEAEFDYESVKLNDTYITNYKYENGMLEIPVSDMTGESIFYVQLSGGEAILTYAFLTYKKDGESEREVISAFYDDLNTIAIYADDVTSTDKIEISGIAPASAEISIKLDGVEQKRVTALKNGGWRSEVVIDNPVNDVSYSISASTVINGVETESAKSVVYNSGYPIITGFICNYSSLVEEEKICDLLDADGGMPKIYFASSGISFEVAFSDAEQIDKCYVTSTRNGEKKYVEAFYDDGKKAFVTKGFFEDVPASYTPGNLNVEYTRKLEQTVVGDSYDWDALISQLPNNANSAMTVKQNTDTDFSATIDMGAIYADLADTVIDTTISVYDAKNGTSLSEWMGSMNMLYNDKLLSYVVPGKDDSKYYVNIDYSDPYSYIMMVQDFTGSQFVKLAIKNAEELAHETDFSKYQTLGEISTYLSGINKISGLLLNQHQIEKDMDKLRREVWQTAYATEEERQTALKRVDALEKDKSLFMIMTTMIPIVMSSSVILGAATMTAPAVLLTGMLGVFSAVAPFFWSMRTAQIKGQSVRVNWVVDPSGIVTDAKNRLALSDVTCSAYWIEYDGSDTFWDTPPLDDEYGSLWNAAEYEQQNPLLTNPDGKYAWDVPEGWWRVKFEKEGYKTVWSDWMTVPPIRTDVNIRLRQEGIASSIITKTEIEAEKSNGKIIRELESDSGDIIWEIAVNSIAEDMVNNETDLEIIRTGVADGDIPQAKLAEIGIDGISRPAEQLLFTQSGDFGFTANISLPVSSDYIQTGSVADAVGTKAVLLQYAPESDSFSLTKSAKVTNGREAFDITRGDDYALVYAINGDTTGDGLVDIEDLLNVLYHSSKRKLMTPLNVGIADTNGDNEVDIEDVLATLYYTSGRRSSL